MSLWRGGNQSEGSDSRRSKRRGSRTIDRGCIGSETRSTGWTRRYTQARTWKQSSNDFDRRLKPFKTFLDTFTAFLTSVRTEHVRTWSMENKKSSRRTAWARARILPQNVLDALQTGGDELTTKKGPVFSTATYRAWQQRRRRSRALLSSLPLENCDLEIQLNDRMVLDCRLGYITKRVWRWPTRSSSCVYTTQRYVTIRNSSHGEDGGKRDFGEEDDE